jgi:predicted GIY-YIG superfamily endonuclease
MTEIDAEVIRLVAEMHAVYRMFDKNRGLLYVGRTSAAGQRFGDHSIKRWFALVANIELEWHPTLAAAEEAEARAIASEKPRYNIRGVTAQPMPIRRAARTTRSRSAARAAAVHVSIAQSEIPSGTRITIDRLLAAGTTISEVAAATGVSRWAARVWLERLREEGAAQVVGCKRTAKWRERPAAVGDGS